jgi:hypothetical protein
MVEILLIDDLERIETASSLHADLRQTDSGCRYLDWGNIDRTFFRSRFQECRFIKCVFFGFRELAITLNDLIQTV